MKKLMYVILVIEIIGALIGFFALLLSDFRYAIISLPFMVLGIIPTLAIINNIEKIENLESEISILYSKLYSLSEENKPNIENSSKDENIPYIKNNKETARGNWECVKCGTVNKKGTSECSNCKAEYSPWTNPTDSEFSKKKISRWIKYK